MTLGERLADLLDKIEVKPEPYKEPIRPHERLEHAVKILTSADSQAMVRQLYWNELKGMSIFWDEEKKEIEFVNDEISIVVTNRK